MLAQIKRLVTPAVFEDEEKTRVAALLNTILLTLIAVVVILYVAYGVTAVISGQPLSREAVFIFRAAFVAVAALFILARSGRVRLTAAAMSLMWMVLATLVVSTGNVLDSSGVLNYAIPIVIAGLLLGGQAAFIVALLCLVILLVLGISFQQIDSITAVFGSILPLQAANFILLAFLLRLAYNSINDALVRARSSNRQLQEAHTQLESRVEARTRDLTLAIEVGRIVSQIHDLDELLTKSVDLIRNHFDLYYTQIYLADEARGYLTLRVGTGSIGAELVRRGHRLPIAAGSINGQAALEKRAIIVEDTKRSSIFRPNPLLPDTKSEMAVPLIVGERVVGVLNMQSAQAEALNEDGLPAFEALAGQLAISIENAYWFARSMEAQNELEAQARQLTHSGWQQFLNALDRAEHVGYVYEGAAVRPIDDPLPVEGNKQAGLTTPIMITGESVGAILLEDEPGREWTEEETEVLKMVAQQVARQVENMRLLAQAEKYRVEAEEATRRLTREAWETYLAEHEKPDRGFTYNQIQVTPLVAEAVTVDASTFTHPLQVRDEVIGEIVIDAAEVLDEDGTELVATVAKQLSAHIENLRLTEQTEKALAETQKRSEELITINHVVSTVASYLDLPQSMDIIAIELAQAISVRYLTLALFDDDRAIMKIVAEYMDDHNVPSMLGYTIPIEGGSFVQQVLDTRSRVVITNASEHVETTPLSELLRQQDSQAFKTISALTLLPMIVGDQVVGIVGIGTLEGNEPLTEEQLRLAETLIFQVSTAIQNARLFQQTQEALDLTESLYNAGRRLSEAVDLQEVLAVVPKTVSAPAINRAVLVIFERDSDNEIQSMVVTANWYSGRGPLPTEVGVRYPRAIFKAVELIFSPEPLYFSDLFNNDQVDPATLAVFQRQNIRSMAVLPLFAGSQQLGAILLEAEVVHHFSEREKAAYAALASQVAVTVENRRLFEQTQTRAAELQEATNFLDSVIENLPVMLFVKDAEELRFVRWNKTGAELTGYDVTDFIGKNDYDIFPEEQAAFFASNDRAVLDSGQLLDIPEEPIQTLNKGLRFLHTRKIPIIGPDGKAKYLLGISEDITERKQAEEALAKRATELQTVAEVSTAASTILETDKLLQTIVNLTKTRFGLYHVHIYLLNEAGDTLMLAAGAGEVGQQMVAQRRQIPLNWDQSIVARAARRREGVIVNDVEADPGFMANPLLPYTRSEMAIPMIVGNTVVGVFDVQSNELDHFTDEDLLIQGTLASQVAVALQNARLYAQTRRRAERERLVNTITQKIQSTSTVESALQTTIQELGQALQARYTRVELMSGREEIDRSEEHSNGTNGGSKQG